MSLFSGISNFFGGVKKTVRKDLNQVQNAAPKVNLNQLVQAARQPIGAAVQSEANKVVRFSAPRISAAATTLTKVPNIRLQGLEQANAALHGGVSKPITIGGLSHKIPVLAQAEQFAKSNSRPQPLAPAVGNFTKQIFKTGAQTAPYVAPELRAVKLAPGAGIAARVGAKFANNAIGGVATSIPASIATGERDPRKIALGALQAGTFNGGVAVGGHAAGKVTKAVVRDAKAGFPALNNQGGFIAGPKASGFFDAASKGKTYLGPDNKPRFEVSDAAAKLSKKGVSNLDKGQVETLGNVLDHKELYKQYPQLKGVRIVADHGLANKALYDEANDIVRINPSKITDVTDLRDSVLHETQHSIQATENTARGGLPGPTDPAQVNKSPDLRAIESQLSKAQVAKDAENLQYKETRDSIMNNTRFTPQQKQRQLQELAAKFNDTEAGRNLDYLRGRHAELTDAARRNPVNQAAVQHYNNLTGEAEARAVEGRSNLSQNQIDANPVDPFYNHDPRTLINSNRVGLAARSDNIDQLARTTTDDELVKLAETNPELAAQISRHRTENGIPNIGSTATDKQRKFVTGVKTSPEVSADVQAAVEGTYTPKSNKELAQRAQNRVNDGSAAEFLDTSTHRGVFKDGLDDHEADEVVATAIAQAKMLDGKGDKLGAAKLYSEIAEKLTNLGRGIQAAKLLARQTAEGQRFQAERAFKNAKIEVPEAARKQLDAIQDRMKVSIKARDDLEVALENANSTAERSSISKQLEKANIQVKHDQYDMGQVVSNNLPASKMDQLTTLWKAGLLSAATTLEGAGVGNIVKTGANIGRDALSAGIDKFFTAPLLNGGKRSNVFGVKTLGARLAGGVEGSKKAGTYIKTGFDERMMNESRDAVAATFKGKNVASWAAKAYTNTVFRPLGVVDQPFFYGELRKSLTEQAQVAAKNAKLKGSSADNFIKDFLSNPPEEARSRAEMEANDATFTNPTMLGKIAAGAKRAAGENPVARALAEVVLPFAKIPSAVATSVINYSPAGAIKEVIQQGINAKKGVGIDARLLNRALADSAIGTGGAMALGSALYSSGNFTLAAPQKGTPEDRLWQEEGKKPYSINIGGHWESLNYIQPFGSLMAMGAAYSDAKKQGKPFTGAIAASAGAGGQAVTQQSFLKGVAGAIAALQDPAHRAQTFAENTVGSVVPNFVKRIAAAGDTDANGQVISRHGSGFGDSLKVGIPGLRTGVTPDRGVFGEQLTTGQGSLGTVFDPFKSSQAKNANDPLTGELRRLQDAKQGVMPSELDKKTSIGGVDVTFDNKAQDTYKQFVGPQIQEAWNKTIATPEYKALPDDKKKSALQSIATDLSAAAKVKLAQGMGQGDIKKATDGLTTQQSQLLKGAGVDPFDYTTDKTELAKDPKKQYAYNLAKYQKDKAAGKLSTTDDFKTRQSLGKEKITSNYSKDTNDLYGMSKTELTQYFTQNPDKKSAYDDLVKLDQELYKNGWTSSLKFKYGLDGVSGSSKKPKSIKYPAQTAPKLKLAKFSAIKGGNTKAKKLKIKVTGVKKGKAVKFATTKA